MALYRGQVSSEKELDDDPTLGKYRDWCKSVNPEITVESLNPETIYLWRLYKLQKGGFPLSVEDLDPGDWENLGQMELIFRQIDLGNLAKALFGSGDKQ